MYVEKEKSQGRNIFEIIKGFCYVNHKFKLLYNFKKQRQEIKEIYL